MKHHRKTFLLFLEFFLLVLSGCSQPQSCETSSFDLYQMLISIDEIPFAETWTVRGPDNFSIDQKRTADLADITFLSDLYPTYLPTYQTVFRYQTIEEAKRDYIYVNNKYGDGQLPEEWTFSSEIADENFISCKEGYPEIDFPLCRWVARYDCFVVEFGSWLIIDRISLLDMENIVREIDQKVGELIPDNY